MGYGIQANDLYTKYDYTIYNAGKCSTGAPKLTDNKMSMRILEHKDGIPIFNKAFETKENNLFIEIHMHSKETGLVTKNIIIKFPITGDIVLDLFEEWSKIVKG